MAKVKFPLEMAEGEQVRTLKELQDKFDLERVIGYFLDGKLQTWLDDRYYEEEAEQLSQINKDDSELAKKLSGIFGVDYIDEIVIDTEEIQRKNERIVKLRQFTDDDKIIANIDNVAFNQEELAELFDDRIETIYLCEGEFHIPKSKQNLTYIEFGGAVVKGKKIISSDMSCNSATAQEKKDLPTFELKLSGSTLFKIIEWEKTILAKDVDVFVNNSNYIFYLSYELAVETKIKKISLLDNQVFVIRILQDWDFWFRSDYDDYIVCTGSNVIWGNGGKISKCDYDGDFVEVIAYPNSRHSQFKLHKNKLYYIAEDDELCCVDIMDKIKDKTKDKITEAKNFCIYNGKLYGTMYVRNIDRDRIFECQLDGTNKKVIATTAYSIEKIECNDNILRYTYKDGHPYDYPSKYSTKEINLQEVTQ